MTDEEVVDEMPTDSVARRQATVQAMIDFVTDAYRGIKPGKPPPIEALQWLLKDLENWD